MTEHELDTLLRDYGGAVRSVCRAILPGHPQDAEEAEADTFYKLWRGAHLPADETHRRRLVVQAARQCAIDRYRALLRRGETLPLDDRDDAELAVALESELETRELMAQVMAAQIHKVDVGLHRLVLPPILRQHLIHHLDFRPMLRKQHNVVVQRQNRNAHEHQPAAQHFIERP